MVIVAFSFQNRGGRKGKANTLDLRYPWVLRLRKLFAGNCLEDIQRKSRQVSTCRPQIQNILEGNSSTFRLQPERFTIKNRDNDLCTLCGNYVAEIIGHKSKQIRMPGVSRARTAFAQQPCTAVERQKELANEDQPKPVCCYHYAKQVVALVCLYHDAGRFGPGDWCQCGSIRARHVEFDNRQHGVWISLLRRYPAVESHILQ